MSGTLHLPVAVRADVVNGKRGRHCGYVTMVDAMRSDKMVEISRSFSIETLLWCQICGFDGSQCHKPESLQERHSI